jgi:hypothetical protein
MLRDHQGVVFDTFNGLWKRGDAYSVPQDHFTDCENIQFIGTSSFATRFGIDRHQNVVVPLGNVVRVYNYPTPIGNTLIVLTYDGSEGKIYHVVDSTTVYGPILTVNGMDDFGFVPYAGRAYISPCSSFVVGDLRIEKGLNGEFLYVYMGDGSAARKAAGSALSGSLTIANGSTGSTDPGFHLFAFVAETDSGYLTAPGVITGFITAGDKSVSFSDVPVSSNPATTKRHLVATRVIASYSGNTTGYTFYFVPDAIINDNISTTLDNISFFDADLLEDASHLLDNYSEIPAGVGLSFYHNRLILYTTYNDISLALVSAPGEPEAISQIDGLIIAPLDGNPITNAQEMRDILYIFKRSKTLAYVDNGDVPSSWPMTVIDAALGACIHGIATVLDSGSASVDQLIIANFKGLNLFNGSFIVPELSWKIQDFWNELERVDFRLITVLNDPTNQIIYLTLPTYKMLIGNYGNGMTPKTIRWCPWKFNVKVNAVALVNIDNLIIAAEGILV